MSAIKEYLDQVRAAGATPTFTNIGGANPMLNPQQGYPGVLQQPGAPGAHLIREQNQPMMDPSGQVSRPQPAAPQQQDAMQSGDPWAMANQSVKKLLPEVWKQIFPDLPPNAELTPSQMQVWQKAVKSTRNGLVDRYKYQLDASRKDREFEAKQKTKEKTDELTMKDKASLINRISEEYNRNKSKLMPGQEMPMTLDQTIEERFAAIERYGNKQALPDKNDGLIASHGPGTQYVTPENVGQGGQQIQMGAGQQQQAIPPAQESRMSPANMQALPYTGYGAENRAGNIPSQEDFQKEINALKAQYGETPEGRIQILQVLRQKYPTIQLPTQ